MKTNYFKSQLTVLIFVFITISLQAQSITISVQNKAAYNARFTVTWNTGKWESGSLMAAQNGKTTLPSNASGIRIKVEKDEVFSWRKIKDQPISRGGTFTTYGTLFNATAEWLPVGNNGSTGSITESVENIDVLNSVGDSKLHLAIRQGSTNEITRLFRMNTVHINTKNNRGFTPLHEAVQTKKNSIVSTLIQQGANLNETDHMGKKPLDIAIEKGFSDIITTLINNGASVRGSNRAFETVIQTKKTNMAKLLLDNGADADFAASKALQYNDITLFEMVLDNYGVQPSEALFSESVSKRRFNFAETLLTKGTNANSAMEIIIQNNAKPLISAALNAGANPSIALDYGIANGDPNLVAEAVGQYGASADQGFPAAIEKNNSQIISFLLDSGANPDLGMEPAIRKNNVTLVATLLEKGAKPNAYLNMAIDGNQEAIVKEFVLKGADYNSGLAHSMSKSNYSIARLMVEAGADSDAQNVVEIAVRVKQTELLRAALSAGANANSGMPTAVVNDDTEYVKMLLDANADATPPEYIQQATNHKNTSMISALLDKGADANYGMPIAITQNNTSVVTMFLQRNADASNPEYMSQAAEFENMTIVTALLEKGASPEPAMPIAFSKNNTTMALALLSKGGNAHNPNYMSQAAEFSNVNLIDALLSQQADPNPGMLPSVSNGNIQIVSKLISAGADATSPDYIASAARQGKLDLVTLLLDNNANPDAGMNRAVGGGFTPIVRLLISRGADGTPAQYIQKACELENNSMVDLLIKSNADPNAGMEISVKKNNASLVGILLNAGADATHPVYLATACTFGNLIMTNMLLNGGADANAGISPAVKGNYSDIVKVLIEKGADVTHPTIITSSVPHNNPILTGLLIEAGADATQALKPAVTKNADKIIRLAREKGVDVTDPELLGFSVQSNYQEATKELLEGGSDPDAWEDPATGYTVIHLASISCNLPIMKMLISKGVDVNATTMTRVTPLHLIVPKGKKYLDHIETLIIAGADVNARDANGEITFKKAKSQKVKKLLKKNGATKK